MPNPWLLAAFTLGTTGTTSFIAARASGVSFRTALAHVGALVLAAAASYYMIDAVDQPPWRAGAEFMVNGTLFLLALVAILRGQSAVRAVAVGGLVAHGAWDLIHSVGWLSPPAHVWLPTACVLTDWGLALLLVFV